MRAHQPLLCRGGEKCCRKWWTGARSPSVASPRMVSGGGVTRSKRSNFSSMSVLFVLALTAFLNVVPPQQRSVPGSLGPEPHHRSALVTRCPGFGAVSTTNVSARGDYAGYRSRAGKEAHRRGQWHEDRRVHRLLSCLALPCLVHPLLLRLLVEASRSKHLHVLATRSFVCYLRIEALRPNHILPLAW